MSAGAGAGAGASAGKGAGVAKGAAKGPTKGTVKGAAKGTAKGGSPAKGTAQGAAKGPASGAGGGAGRTPARSAARAGAGSGAGAGVGGGATGGGAWLAKPLRPLRIVAYALLVVVGAVVGIAGALVQSAWFPGGLLLALLGLAALCYGGLYATGARAGAWSPAGGWLMVVLFLTATRPEGDFVFGSGVGSYLFLLGGMFAGVMCATVPKVPQPPASGTRLGK
ncbi:DUF6113 family protein [Streptomyces buecherae]|uniref:DUF6113 family protein n=1 Tax=Streptomyces buecherae TaxID=2763006 RepID=UPI0036B31EE8